MRGRWLIFGHKTSKADSGSKAGETGLPLQRRLSLAVAARTGFTQAGTVAIEGPIARRTNEPKAFWGNVFNLFRMAGRNEAEFFELRLFE